MAARSEAVAARQLMDAVSMAVPSTKEPVMTGKRLTIPTFVGRQPVFDRDMNVVGYELLFREGTPNRAVFNDGDQATSAVILGAFVDMGLSQVVGDVPAYINTPRNYLLGRYPIPANRDQVVIEVDAEIARDPEAVLAMRLLAGAGYRIALDHYVHDVALEPALEIAHIVKIDVGRMENRELDAQVELLQNRDVKLHALRVANRDRLALCKALEFHQYQGVFLREPEVLQSQRPRGDRLTVVRLLARLYDPDVSFSEIERLLVNDVSLSHRLLSSINSAMFALPDRVDSIRQMVVLLGARRLREWTSLIALSGVSGKPSELLVQALVRARLCENVAKVLGRSGPEIYFTAGLFSILDALLDRPLAQIMSELPLTEEVKRAVVAHDGPIGGVLQAAIGHETGDFAGMEQLHVSPQQANETWLDAVTWADQCREQLLNA
jgi:EAL and modified HD-GYP domain-containing signal transduction protein